jgi:uncharacterized membrane protein YdfJ with MMPL/SSD domain
MGEFLRFTGESEGFMSEFLGFMGESSASMGEFKNLQSFGKSTFILYFL